MGSHLGLHLKNERKTKFKQLRVKAELEEMKAEEEDALEEQMLKLKKEKRKINIKYEKEEIRRLEQKVNEEQSQVHHSTTANYVNKNDASQPLYSHNTFSVFQLMNQMFLMN